MKNIFGFVSVVSSVFVVALSVYSAFSEDVVRGKYLHDNAKRVTNLYQQYKIDTIAHEAGKNPDLDTMRYERQYATIMDACPYNHDSIDYRSAMIEINDVRDARRFWSGAEIAFDTYFWPFLAIALPPLALGVGFLLFPEAIGAS